MTSINTAKVVIGGLLAGLVFNVIDLVMNGMILAEEMSANLTRLKLDPAAMETPAGMATWIVIDFLLGIIAVFTYAAIRPRFGPGPKTAAIAAVVIWVSISLVMFGISTGGMMSMGLYTKITVMSLINTIVGTTAGAWLYKEA